MHISLYASFFFFFNHSCTFLLVFLFFCFSFDSRIDRAFEFVRRLIILLLPLPPSLQNHLSQYCADLFSRYTVIIHAIHIYKALKDRVYIYVRRSSREWTNELSNGKSFERKIFPSTLSFATPSFSIRSQPVDDEKNEVGLCWLSLPFLFFFFSLG